MTPFLSLAEVSQLDELFLCAYHAVDDVRRRSALGSALHAVKVPPRLSEGIVVAHCREIFGTDARAVDRRRPHDVTIRVRRHINVAVKGSGLKDWAAVTAADRLADVLVWVDYRDRLCDGSAPVLVWRIHIGTLPAEGNRAFLRTLCDGTVPVAIYPGR